MPGKYVQDKTVFPLKLTTAGNVMGKQSVWTAFRLSTHFIDALRGLAAQLGIRQKALYDRLMEDAASLRAIAHQAGPGQLGRSTRVQKTFVIIKKRLSSLEVVSKKYETPRDDWVMYLIQRLLPILTENIGKITIKTVLHL